MYQRYQLGSPLERSWHETSMLQLRQNQSCHRPGAGREHFSQACHYHFELPKYCIILCEFASSNWASLFMLDKCPSEWITSKIKYACLNLAACIDNQCNGSKDLNLYNYSHLLTFVNSLLVFCAHRGYLQPKSHLFCSYISSRIINNQEDLVI